MNVDYVSDPTTTDETKAVKLFGRDASEVAKYYGMFLKNKGVLRSYAEGNNPLKIVVNWPAGKACFHAWYTTEKLESGDQGTKIVVECGFIRKVFISNNSRAQIYLEY